jgi:type VI secretion system secreted protein Hcp
MLRLTFSFLTLAGIAAVLHRSSHALDNTVGSSLSSSHSVSDKSLPMREFVQPTCSAGAYLVYPSSLAPCFFLAASWMRVKSKKVGDIKSTEPANPKGKEGLLKVFVWETDVRMPLDPASGLPTGKRRHQPVTAIIRLDNSFPLLFSALVNNEVLTDVRIDAYQPSISFGGGSGTEKNVLQVHLISARIAQIQTVDPISEPRCPSGEFCARVKFAFDKIEYTWISGGITAMDDWATAVV